VNTGRTFVVHALWSDNLSEVVAGHRVHMQAIEGC
jgi:hypothetical protein